MKKKLVLFDIDGTLITSKGNGVAYWKSSMVRAFEETYRTLPKFNERAFNGKLERRYFRELADMARVPKAEFLKKFPRVIELFATYFKAAIDDGRYDIYRIDHAFELVESLQNQKNIMIGLLTGNNEPLAWYKLKAANFDKPFVFGAFGTEVEDRGELVLLAIKRAGNHFSQKFLPKHTVVIGDTKHDVEAAKHAGAFALGVTTGKTDRKEDLEKAGADLVVDSLLDERVLSLLGLQT